MMTQSHDTQRIRPVPQVTYNTMDFKRMLCSGKQTQHDIKRYSTVHQRLYRLHSAWTTPLDWLTGSKRAHHTTDGTSQWDTDRPRPTTSTDTNTYLLRSLTFLRTSLIHYFLIINAFSSLQVVKWFMTCYISLLTSILGQCRLGQMKKKLYIKVLFPSIILYSLHSVEKKAAVTLIRRSMAQTMYRARQKSNPLGKIRYLWNCSKSFSPN